MSKHLKRFLNSGMGYLPFKIVEGVFGIIALSLYSHLLTPDTYGGFGLVNVTVMLTYLLAIGWFNFVATRYVSEQKTENEKKEFYSNILTLQGRILATLFVMYIVFGLGLLYLKEYNIRLLALYILFFVGYTLNQFYIYLLLFVNKRFQNVMLMLLTSIIRPTLVYILYKAGVDVIYILFLGHGLTDLVIGSIAFYQVGAYKYYDRKFINPAKFKTYFEYGFPLIGLTLTMYILNISDRYLIQFFYSKYDLGLYVPNYAIASAAFLMISYGLSRGFYPKLLAEWKNGNKEKASIILRNSIKNYLFVGLPAATGMYILSDRIGTLFISEEYAKGYPIIGIVAFGMFFLALAEYANKEWELSGNTKPIFMNSVKAAILNLILNFIFIPLFGFIAAAYTTCFSFFVYFIICFLNRKKEITYRLNAKEIFGMILSTVIMGFVVLFCGLLPFKGLILLIIQVTAGIVSYMIMILLLNVYSIKKLLHHE